MPEPDTEDRALPVAKSVEPQLGVTDIVATVAHWQDVIGFTGKWLWGDPPVHAGVNWGETQIQFTLSPELAAKAEGQQLAINVTHIEALYAIHKSRGAEIVSPLETHPWGQAGYTVREINGYRLRFVAPASNREKSSHSLPDSIRILPRVPSIDEYTRLRQSVGWFGINDADLVKRALDAAVFGVVAEDTATGDVVGSALLLGDGASFYYVKDVNVHPDWQSKRVGTALMRRLMEWANENAPDWSSVTLFTGEQLKGFYAQFGFSPSYGMGLTIHRSNNDAKAVTSEEGQ